MNLCNKELVKIKLKPSLVSHNNQPCLIKCKIIFMILNFRFLFFFNLCLCLKFILRLVKSTSVQTLVSFVVLSLHLNLFPLFINL